MKKIVSLVDFSGTTLNALDHAIHMTRKRNGELLLLHVSTQADNDEKRKEIEGQFEPYLEKVRAAGLTCTVVIEEGNFFDRIDSILTKLFTDLLVVGTHGKKGWKQSLLGSNILKLVKRLHVPSLIIQENTAVPAHGYRHVLFPFGPQSDVELKFTQTCPLIPDDGKLNIYYLNRTGHEMDRDTARKLENLVQKGQSEGMDCVLSKEDITTYSVGNAKQTIEFASEHGCDLISIMADVPDKSSYYGYADKENVILNPSGIPTLCVI
jgi:nucleotide-binding universal stress UspA family protein